MNGSKGLLHILLAGIWLSWVVNLPAEPVDRVVAEAAAKGWLAEERQHLAARFHSQIKSAETFPNFHVIHLQPEGFIVTAADDELEPVLAFSDKGHFKYDPESPLCLMLSQDVPARTKRLREARTKPTAALAPKATVAGLASTTEPGAISDARRARDKWERFRNQSSRAMTGPVAQVARMGLSSGPSSASGSANLDSFSLTPVRILDLRIVNDHVELTHDGLGSVTIFGSYDEGATWQVIDSGIVWPTWTAKQSVQEASCWYRVESDGLYDEMMVNLMRHPSPAAAVATVMTNEVSPPGEIPGLSGSVGAVSDIRVAPLVRSTWNQSGARGVNCYNYYTPNNYVDGCVATALAQLMRYWQFPTAGIGRVTRTVYVNGSPQSATTRGGDGSGGAYNWSAMPLSPATVNYNAAQWQMVGSLCFDAGVSVNMQYAGGGSGAYMYQCASALSSVFQYANAKYVNYPGSNLLLPIDSNLAAGCPVLFGISNSGRSGHAVVCDGFGYDSGTLYHHINFGWDGAYNAWYALPYLETPYSFNSIDTIIYNVFPTGSGELLTGRILTSQAAPVVGAAVTATASGQSYSGTTDAKGYYGLKVPSARTYSVTAGKTGMNSATRTGVIVGTSGTSGAGNQMGIDFTLNNNFSLAAVGLTGSVWLRWTAPTNSGLPTNTVYLRQRTDRYPTNSTDGNLLYSGTAQAYEHTGVDTSGTVTNYYTIWGDNGSAYASLGPNVYAASFADRGAVRVLWTRVTGEVYTWNLKATGQKKSAAFVTSGLISMTDWKPAGFNDIDRDGVADILWTRSTGEVVYWLLNADGTMKTSGFVTPGNATRGGYYKLAGFNDIDRDGTADILWTGGAGGEVGYWLLNADGTLKSTGLVTTGNSTRSGYFTVGGFADIDRDGTADILWVGGAGGEVGYWLLNANGTMKSAGAVVAGNSTRSGYYTVAGFGDIDGDGTADIIWSGAGGEVGYWMLNANGTRKSAGAVSVTPLTPASYWSIRAFRDINGDGVPDLIWHGQAGETRYWLLNANGTFASSGNIDTVPVSKSTWTLRAAR